MFVFLLLWSTVNWDKAVIFVLHFSYKGCLIFLFSFVQHNYQALFERYLSVFFFPIFSVIHFSYFSSCPCYCVWFIVLDLLDIPSTHPSLIVLCLSRPGQNVALLQPTIYYISVRITQLRVSILSSRLRLSPDVLRAVM